MARSNTAAIVVGSGLLLGLALGILTFLVARYGPSGDSGGGAWSFRGNGALIVPFGLGPAALAGGWTAVLLHGRPGVRYLAWGLLVFGVGVLFVLISVLATVTGNAAVSNFFTIAMVALPLVAPIGLILIHRKPQTHSIRHTVAQAVFTLSGLVGFVLGEQILPPGS